MRPEETAALAASASGPGAAETRVAARLSLAASARGRAGAERSRSGAWSARSARATRRDRPSPVGDRGDHRLRQLRAPPPSRWRAPGTGSPRPGVACAPSKTRSRQAPPRPPSPPSRRRSVDPLSEYPSTARRRRRRAPRPSPPSRAPARAWPRAAKRSRRFCWRTRTRWAPVQHARRAAARRGARGRARGAGATLRRVERPRRNRNRNGGRSFRSRFLLGVLRARRRAARAWRRASGAGDDDGASETEDASAAGDDDNENAKTRNRETEASRWSRARRALCADEATAAAVYFSAYEVRREVRRDEDGVAFTCGHVASDASLRASAAALADAWRAAGVPDVRPPRRRRVRQAPRRVGVPGVRRGRRARGTVRVNICRRV